MSDRTPAQKAAIEASADKAIAEIKKRKEKAASKKAAPKKAAARTEKLLKAASEFREKLKEESPKNVKKKAAAEKKAAAAEKPAKKQSASPRNTSGVENPVQLIWETCSRLYAEAVKAANLPLARKSVWAELEPKGVNANTFARQWQEWKSSGGMA